MKTSNYGSEHPADIIRLRTAAGISTAPNPAAVVQQFTNADAVDFAAGDVVVITAAGILGTTTAQDTRPVGVVLDDIAVGDTGPVQTAGYTPYIHVTAAVSADAYAETSTTATEATQNPTARDGSFGLFLTAGTTPDGLLFGTTDGGIAVIPSGTYLTATEGEQHVVNVNGGSGTTATIDCSLANIFDITLTANCVFTITNPPPDGVGAVIYLILRQGGSGSYTVTFPAEVVWQDPATGLSGGSAPILFTAVGAQNVILLETLDGGLTWGGSDESTGSGPVGAAGGDLSGTYPNPTVAKINGVAITGSPAVGQVPIATGATSGTWQNLPTSSGQHILLADGHATPFVFTDMLQMDDGTDFMWSD